MMTRHNLLTVLCLIGVLVVVGFGLTSCLSDASDDPIDTEVEDEPNEAFNGRFQGTIAGTEGDQPFVDSIIMDLQMQSPLHGTFLRGNGETGAVEGEVEGDVASVTILPGHEDEGDHDDEADHEDEADSDHDHDAGDCPMLSGSLTLIEGDERLSVQVEDPDCEGEVFSFTGILDRLEAGEDDGEDEHDHDHASQ